MSNILGIGVLLLEISQRSARILISVSQEAANKSEEASPAAKKDEEVILNLYLSPLLSRCQIF